MKNVRVNAVGDQPRNTFVNIGNNPIKCDCEIYDFLRFLLVERNRIVFMVDKLICHDSDFNTGTKVADLQYKNFECPVIFSNFSSENTCTSICDCRKKPFDDLITVNCSSKGLNKFTELISIQNVSKIFLYMDSNNVTKFPDLQESGYDKVELLDLSNNRINDFDENIFTGNIKVKFFEILK